MDTRRTHIGTASRNSINASSVFEGETDEIHLNRVCAYSFETLMTSYSIFQVSSPAAIDQLNIGREFLFYQFRAVDKNTQIIT